MAFSKEKTEGGGESSTQQDRRGSIAKYKAERGRGLGSILVTGLMIKTKLQRIIVIVI